MRIEIDKLDVEITLEKFKNKISSSCDYIIYADGEFFYYFVRCSRFVRHCEICIKEFCLTKQIGHNCG